MYSKGNVAMGINGSLIPWASSCFLGRQHRVKITCWCHGPALDQAPSATFFFKWKDNIFKIRKLDLDKYVKADDTCFPNKSHSAFYSLRTCGYVLKDSFFFFQKHKPLALGVLRIGLFRSHSLPGLYKASTNTITELQSKVVPLVCNNAQEPLPFISADPHSLAPLSESSRPS